jgi:protein phosphatase
MSYDLVGDVHGCADELDELLTRLGYRNGSHPDGRTAVFVGDLVDRGPDTPRVLRTVMGLGALAVTGNHEAKLVRALDGRAVRRSHGLETSLNQLSASPTSGSPRPASGCGRCRSRCTSTPAPSSSPTPA